MPRPAPTPTTTSYALLGLLRLRPWTTYELAKQVQRSLGWFWPRTERSLYDEPKKLVTAGWAEASKERTGRRPKTVYTITADGRRALRRWLGEPPEPPSLEFEAMVKVFFADAGSVEQLRSTLDVVEAGAEDRLRRLREMIDASREGSSEFADRLPINALGLRFWLDHEQQVADWARWARDQVRTWESPTDVGDWDWSTALS